MRHRIRQDFPALHQKIHGQNFVYLDTAASAQKPQIVLNQMMQFYAHDYANVHRGVYELAARATMAYEGARKKVQSFLNAASSDEIIFTKGGTEAFNLVAQSFGRHFLKAGDIILLTEMEHHANIVPWQILRDQIGIEIQVIPVLNDGRLNIPAYEKMLTDKVKLIGMTHMSNSLGTVNPIKKLIKLAHTHNIPVLIDGCQSAVHMPIDVQDLDCDFFVITGHKLYGPTGIGALYAKSKHLEKMPPYQGGGDMIMQVSFEKTTFKDPPYRFEAGTPPIVQAIGLGYAIDYLQSIHLKDALRAEHQLYSYAAQELAEIDGLHILGNNPDQTGIISFTMDGIHPHDLSTFLDHAGIAVRAGHHCNQPLMKRFALPATARMSLGIYNTHEDVKALVEALYGTRRFFGV